MVMMVVVHLSTVMSSLSIKNNNQHETLTLKKKKVCLEYYPFFACQTWHSTIHHCTTKTTTLLIIIINASSLYNALCNMLKICTSLYNFARLLLYFLTSSAGVGVFLLNAFLSVPQLSTCLVSLW